MKRRLEVLTAFLLFLSLGAFGQQAEAGAGGEPPLAIRAERPVPSIQIEAAQRTRSLQVVEMQVSIDGRLALSETTLLPRDAEAVAVEILRGHPQTLAALSEMKASRVLVHVVLDGLTLGDFTLAELAGGRRGDRTIGGGRLEVLAADLLPEPKGMVRERPLLSANTSSCSDACETEWSNCMAQNCPFQVYCEVCEEQRSQCLDYCWCIDNPTGIREVSYYYGPVTSSCYSLGSICLQRSWAPYDPAWHYWYRCCQQRIYYRHTVYCDGHWVDEQVSTQNLGCINCFEQTPYWCSSPAGSPTCDYYP